MSYLGSLVSLRWDLPCMVYITNYRSSVESNLFSIKNLFIAGFVFRSVVAAYRLSLQWL